MARASTFWFPRLKIVDGRDKPGHDGPEGWLAMTEFVGASYLHSGVCSAGAPLTPPLPSPVAA